LLLTLPVFDALHLVKPRLRLDFWANPTLVRLLAGKPYFGRVYSCDGPELLPFFHDNLWQSAAVPMFLRGAQGVFIFGQARSRILADRLGVRLRCPVFWLRSFPEPGGKQPVSLFLLEQLRRAGWPVPQGELVPCLEPDADEQRYIHEWLQNEGLSGGSDLVVVHPGSGGWRKIWPLRRWWALLHTLLRDRRLKPLVVIGPADECLAAFAHAVVNLGVRLLRDVALPRLAAVLAASRLYIGNDSGVTHLAAALGVPTIAIFGPTAPEVWGPRGRQVRVIESSWEEQEILLFLPDAKLPPLETALVETLQTFLPHLELACPNGWDSSLTTSTGTWGEL
jgi:ADP-heptose:LPS heptosyltransferase